MRARVCSREPLGPLVRGAERLPRLWPFLTLGHVNFPLGTTKLALQLLAMDALAQLTMKDAAKCDKRCEWQNSANQENAERNLRL